LISKGLRPFKLPWKRGYFQDVKRLPGKTLNSSGGVRAIWLPAKNKEERESKRGEAPLINYFPLPYQREGDKGGGLPIKI